ncbi:MAG: hypothetical protein JWM93_3779 [Frankiales bacterium]|nr:hypothetical protein [Frankiales bacterium]
MTQTKNTSTATHDESIETVRLSGDALPCGDCGCAVETPDPSTVGRAEMVRSGRAILVSVAKCPACVARDRLSTDLAQRYLRGGVTLESRLYVGKDAVSLLVESRVGIDAAGMEPTSLDLVVRPGAVLAVEIEHLSRAVLGLRWRDRLSPPTSLVADPIRTVRPGTANARPWAHLQEKDLARLRKAVGLTLIERLALRAPSVALAPPGLSEGEVGSGGTTVAAGCLYCGVSSVTMTALAVARHGGPEAAARTVWTQRKVNPAALGGQRGASLLIGWLCPPCEKAAADVGSANSLSAMEGALSTYLGVSRRTATGDELWVDGLDGWGALVAIAIARNRPVPSPNAEPWGHLTWAERDVLAQSWRLGGT